LLTQIDVVFEVQVGEEIEEQSLALPILGVTPKDSLLIRKVTGLDAPDRDLFIGDFARDGGIYQGSRVGNRNVVMTLDLNPNPALGETVRGLRDVLYKTFMDPLIYADHVELVLHDDDGNMRNLYGYTEKLETEIFDIETMAQVSMICPDPYIRSLIETALVNTSGTWVTVPFTYGGTAETGFEVEVHQSVDITTLTLTNNYKTMTITDVTPMAAGSAVYINTNRGSRDIRKATIAQANAVRTANPSWTINQVWAELIRIGQALPMVAKLTATSPWLQLHSQANLMGVNVGSGVKQLVYRESFWGV
jgi:hypothetical protein